MRLVPFHAVDGLPFSASACDVAARHGAPVRRSCNAAGLDEWDYGDVVFRFQVSTGRLEEVTRRAPVLYLGPLDVPFAALRSVVKAHDAAAFERAGFLVSPRFGLAFVPSAPDWVTALAAHCIDTWRQMGGPAA